MNKSASNQPSLATTPILGQPPSRQMSTAKPLKSFYFHAFSDQIAQLFSSTHQKFHSIQELFA